MKFRNVQYGAIVTSCIALIPVIQLLVFNDPNWRYLKSYVRFLNLYLYFEFDFRFELKKGG